MEEKKLFRGTDYNKVLENADGFTLTVINKEKDGESYSYTTEYEDGKLIDDSQNAYRHFVEAIATAIESYADMNAINPCDLLCDINGSLSHPAELQEQQSDNNVTYFQVNADGKLAPNKYDYEAAVALMDDELREEIHQDIAPCSKQMFFEEYCIRHLKKYGTPFQIN